MLKNKIRLFISAALLVCITGVFDAQPREMSADEYEFIKDEYAIAVIKLMVRRDTLDYEISKLKDKLSGMDAEMEKLESDLYALVGTTKSGVNEFRRKFEETEKRINNRTGTPADARSMFYDEIHSSKIKCLPEFSARFASMKKQMEDWEGIKIVSPTETKEIQPVAEGTYVVVKGDCLWKISTLKYSSPYYWPAIWEANKNGVVNKDDLPDYRHKAITNPNLIYPGQVLKIPSLNTDPVNKGDEFREKFKKFRKIRKKE